MLLGVLKKSSGSLPGFLPGRYKIKVALTVKYRIPDNLFNSKISWQNPWAQKRTRVLTRVLTKLICVQMLLRRAVMHVPALLLLLASYSNSFASIAS